MRPAIGVLFLIFGINGSAATCDDAAQAVACLEKSVAEQPKDAFLHYRLGMTYRQLGENRRAVRHLQFAIENGFSNLAAQVNLVEAAFATGQSALAVKTAGKIVTPNLKSPGLLLSLGRLLFDHLFYKEAATAFQLACELSPDALEPRFRLALTHYLLKDYAQTVSVLESHAGFESNPEVASLDASAKAELGQIDKAESLLRQAMLSAPQSPHPYMNLALMDMDRSNERDAEHLLERLQSLPRSGDTKVFYSVNHNFCHDVSAGPETGQAPEKAEFYFQLASQLEKGFQYASAVALLHLMQPYEGKTPRLLYLAGASCLNLDGQAPEAIQLLKEAVSKNPRFAMAWYMLGRAYTRRGNLDQARKSFERAAELQADPSYWLALGKALAGENRERARQAYQKAIALNPGYVEAHFELGRLFANAQDVEQARRELEKTLELEPDFYQADYLLGRLYFRLGEKEQAAKHIASFEEKKSVLMGQALVGSGYIFNGQ